MITWRVPTDTFHVDGEGHVTQTTNLDEWHILPIWSPGGTLTQCSIRIGLTGSDTIWRIQNVDSSFTPVGVPIASGVVTLIPNGWYTIPMNVALTAGLYALVIVNSSPDTNDILSKRLAWYPSHFLPVRMYTGGSYSWQTPYVFTYTYTIDGVQYGQPFHMEDNFILSNTTVAAASVFQLPNQIPLRGIAIMSTSTGPYRLSLYNLSGGLPNSEIVGATVYSYPFRPDLSTPGYRVQLLFDTVQTVQNFAVVWRLQTGGSTTSRWWGSMRTDTSALRSLAFPNVYAANYNGSNWSADYTMVRPVQLITETGASGGSGFPPSSFYRRMI